ncbi:MAG: serine/threonine-protein phosphatase, partial [Xanthomonadales bacterium]|nr:serine/threonine-protein phosphatase [Xanthomonadales bacterium]
LEVTGGVVGLFPFAQYQVAEAVLNPGDQLLSYTDGVNEAKNERGEQFTEDRILDVASAGYTDGNELLRNVVARIIEFRGEAEPSDDITMLALRRLDGG